MFGLEDVDQCLRLQIDRVHHKNNYSCLKTSSRVLGLSRIDSEVNTRLSSESSCDTPNIDMPILRTCVIVLCCLGLNNNLKLLG